MVKVITYGTYDLLHEGHVRLLQRAKALGDYLVVGVTAEGFDRARGKINVKQSLMERIAAVRSLGLADEIIVEEYEGQKIDDIRRYGIDIFTVGSDWKGKFDYLGAYCQVVYLPRTEGVSSSGLRAASRRMRLGLVGDVHFLEKICREAQFVNGVEISGLCSEDPACRERMAGQVPFVTGSYGELLDRSDAVYLLSHPREHYAQAKEAFARGKHVLCESPVALERGMCLELFRRAEEAGVVLMEGIKTAYAMAFYRLLLLVQSGRIGDVVAVDAVCTSLRLPGASPKASSWGAFLSWGPIAMLPVFQLLGTGYRDFSIQSIFLDEGKRLDLFTRMSFVYPHAVATLKVGTGVKSEGDLVISGTRGYAYVPAPWWKTDYFELRYEKASDNKRYFYGLDGEGIRYEIVSFLRAVETGRDSSYIPRGVTLQIAQAMDEFLRRKNFRDIGGRCADSKGQESKEA